MSDTSDRFQAARRFERELTARQREILGMLAAGRTNSEIGAAFDITPDGAKWHISEIYSKLGLASREEAAAYWHWRRGLGVRSAAFARALVPAGIPLKVAGGAFASVAVVGVVIAMLVFGREDAKELNAETPYAATVEIVTSEGASSRLEISYQDPQHYTSRLLGDAGLVALMTADGEQLSTWYDRQGNSTNATTVTDLPPGDRQPAHITISMAMTAGRIFGESIEAGMEAAIMLSSSSNAYARIVGSEKVLGRETTIVETGPVYGMSTSNSSGTTTTEAGSSRQWVDNETLVVLRHVTEGSEGETYRAEVVAFEPSPVFGPGTFLFQPPPGSGWTPNDPSERPGAQPDLTGAPIAPGFLAVTELPPGMENSGYSATYFPPNSVFEVRFQSASVPRSKDAPVLLTMTQTERPDDPRDIGGAGATVSTVQLPFAERATLVVRGNDLQLHIRIPLVDVVIETNALTPGELVAWAETLERR